MHRDIHVVAGLLLSLYHALFAVGVPIALWLWLSRIGLSWSASVSTALLYAFASPAWIFSKSFYSEPYFPLGLVGCSYFLGLEDRPAWLLAAGTLLGFSFGARVYGLVLAPVFLLYALLVWNIGNLLRFGTPICISIGVIALSNQVRFGSVMKSGYQLHSLRGLRGLLTDGNAGLFIYVPWVLLVPFLWGRFWRSYRKEAILVLGVSVINLVFFAKYSV